MIFKNLLRRRGRTTLTIMGVSVGVATIIVLGALANGIEEGYQSMFTNSADFVLSQTDAYDITLGGVDEAIGEELMAMPEVAAASPMLVGNVTTEGAPYFFVYGYPEDSFVLERFQVIRGVRLGSREARHTQGTPLLLGSSAAEALNRDVGDTIRLGEAGFRVIGIYETGDAFEDGGAVIGLRDAQELLGKSRKASLFYIQLEAPEMQDRFVQRISRRWPNLLLSTTADFANSQEDVKIFRQMAWGVAGLAIVIGGVGMMNAQLMAVFERTREIGVLRAVGWSGRRVLTMILGESLVVTLSGGLLGVVLGWLTLRGLSGPLSIYGTSTASIGPSLLGQAIVTVLLLGTLGGMIPASRASQLQPIEALRYEGGSTDNSGRLPVGGMAAQSLWRRKVRTFLALGGIGLTVGAIMLLDVVVQNVLAIFTNMFFRAGAEIVVREEGVSDMGYSTLDERVGDRIAALPEVEHVSGMTIAIAMVPETPLFFAFGYAPNEFAVQQYNVVEGERITGNRQIMLGRAAAETLNKEVGDILEVGGSRFRVVGIYESGALDERGSVISLRDAQLLNGQPRQVTFYMVGVRDPDQAEAVVEYINTHIPEAHAGLSGEFLDQAPDMRTTRAMVGGVTVLATVAGGIGVMNTMLMAVLERTREIGALRALGWRRLQVLGMILQESLLLGVLGSVVGMCLAFMLIPLIKQSSFWGILVADAAFPPELFLRALGVAIGLGLIGGLYPAYRATRLRPVEALRYE